MKRALLALLVLAAGVAVTACSGNDEASLPRPSKPFCEAAHRYDVRVEKRAPIDEQIQIVQKMADHAPKDIAHDTNVFLDALQRRGMAMDGEPDYRKGATWVIDRDGDEFMRATAMPPPA